MRTIEIGFNKINHLTKEIKISTYEIRCGIREIQNG